MGRVQELGDLDITTEEGYREFTRKAAGLLKELTVDLEFAAAVIGGLLEHTPPALQGVEAKREARKVRGFLRRAALVQPFAAGQITKAFRLFETVWVESPKKRRGGMQMNDSGKKAA